VGADYKPRLYSVALTKRQIRQLAKLEKLPGRFGRLGEMFRRKLDYINFAEHRGVITAVGRAPFTSHQEAALEVEDMDEERFAEAQPR
jgi:hypothetical protein